MDVVHEASIEAKVTIFTAFLNSLFQRHAPIKTVRVTRPKAPWLTDDIRALMKQRERAKARFKRTKHPDDLREYKRLRNRTLSRIRVQKAAHMRNILTEGNSRKTWSALRDMNIKDRQSEIPDNLRNVDDINSYFSSVFVDKNCREMVDCFDRMAAYCTDVFYLRIVESHEVAEAIGAIRSNAFGTDNITLAMLKYCCPYIIDIITHLINVCIERSYFPDAWKISNVRPLAKNNDPQCYSDLRPISLLPVLSKVLEKIICRQVVEYCSKNNIIPQNQSGFREGHSTAAAMADVLNGIVRDLDQGKVSALVLLDFSKAFDTINHELLCSQLRYYGFHQTAIQFFESYLGNRSQRVVLDNQTSGEVPVKSGVPQGSILGPVLFLVYSAHIIRNISQGRCQAYADDVQINYSFLPKEHHVAEYIINNEINYLASLCEKHNLKLNPDKCSVLYFGGSRVESVSRYIDIQMDTKSLETKKMAKTLGLLVDKNLSFSDHVNNVIKKAFYKLKLLYSNRYVMSRKLKVMLCESLVLSCFNYCDFVYGPFLTLKIQRKIQRLQNSCCRFVCSLRKYDHVSEHIKSLKWLNMTQRRQLHLAVFVHKVLTTSSPMYLRETLVFPNGVYPCRTRYSNLLSIPGHKTALFQKCFSYQAPHLYNKIPPELKSLKTITFKNRYKKLLLDL